MALPNEVFQILAMLAATYPRFNLTKETSLVYSQMLRDIPADMLKAAALQCARTRDFFPSVNELLQAVYDLNSKIQGIPSPAEAWKEVALAKSDYRDWSHPLVKKVAYDLGWNNYLFPTDNISTDRAHFFKAYDRAIQDYFSDSYALPEIRDFIESSKQLYEQLPAGE